MNSSVKSAIIIVASAAALYLGKSYFDKRMEYGTSFMRPGRWF